MGDGNEREREGEDPLRYLAGLGGREASGVNDNDIYETFINSPGCQQTRRQPSWYQLPIHELLSRS